MRDRVIFGKQSVPTLIALTKEEQAYGLMYKLWPPPVMSFPYEDARIRKFWMKNTSSPLDIVFCKSNQVISIVEGTPFSLDFIGPDKSSDLVVELPLGFAQRMKITAGTEVHLQYGIFSLAKKMELKIKKLAEIT